MTAVELQYRVPPPARSTMPTEPRAEGDDHPVQAADTADGSPPIGGTRDETILRFWGLNRFIQELGIYRRTLAEAWSNDTAHPDFRKPEGNGSAPYGQCGVSSVWLLQRLDWFNRRRAWYCCGDLRFGNNSLGRLHCWIEVGRASSSKRLVIDVTYDQFELVGDGSVLCDRVKNLLGRTIEYDATTRRRLSAVAHDDEIWDRLKILKDATGRLETIGQVKPAMAPALPASGSSC